MFAASPLLREALAASHEMTVEVVILRDGDAIPVNTSALNGEPDGAGVTDLSCQATLGTRGGRSASLTVDRTLLDEGLFDPLVDDVVIRTGVRGVGDIPLFTGRVDSVDDDETGNVDVTLMSRADELKRARFETPYPSNRGLSTTEQMRAIIQSVNPDWAVQASVVEDPPVPTAVWEEDPGQALDDLATGINALWAPDRTGDFAIFTNPYVLTAEPLPVAVLRDGADGVLVQVRHVRSREQINNSVTVVVERTDGLAPIRVTVRDTASTSRTRWGGPFGKQNEVIKTQTTLNRPNATVLANRRLAQSLALARSWSITLPPGTGQLLDPGDLVAVWYRGEVTGQVIESIRYAGHARAAVVADTRQFRTLTPAPD
jgi:hypothetical protein